MNIVLDNIIYSIQKAGGISVVWNNLIENLLKSNENLHFIEYNGCNKNESRKELLLPEELIENRDSSYMTLKRYMNCKYHNKEKFIFHSSYFRLCKSRNAINITTVHDFTYDYFVNNPIVKNVHNLQMYSAIKGSDRVICISENTKKDLLKFIPQVDEAKIDVVYNGVSSVFKRIDLLEKPAKEYVIFVGRRDKYKNFDKIIDPVRECGLKLLIVGNKLSPDEITLLQKKNCDFKYLGFVSDEELNRLYNNAYCLVYPSSYEGFGLPVIEAQKAGCPVIAYNGSSIPEIIGYNNFLLNSLDPKEITEKLQVLHNQEIRTQLINIGLENSKKFTWQEATQKYLKIYEKAWNENS